MTNKDVNIIDFSRTMKAKLPAEWFEKGMRTFRNLSPEDQREIWDFITTYLLCEVRINKGLIKVEMDILDNDDNFRFADEIDDIYTESAHGCFMCDPKQDSNDPFDGKTYVCLFCQNKIRNIVNHYVLHVTEKDKPDWYKQIVKGRGPK
jgi:hypothetical protein